MRCWAVGALVALLACDDPSGSPKAEATEASVPAPSTSVTSSAMAVPSEASAAPSASAPARPVDPEAWPFLEWVATRCYVDELGPSTYGNAWLRYHADPKTLPDDDALIPRSEAISFPRKGTPEAAARARTIAEAWTTGAPQSHVVDCRLTLTQRWCHRCRRGENGSITAHYVAYLPAALLTEPKRVRAALLLIPGGNGGRSRPFLTALPGKTIFQRGSGGLRTKQLVDAYLEEHPATVPPLVVALETAGRSYVNGSVEHLAHDVPNHVAEVFLGGVPREDYVLGAEGISSGSTAILSALYEEPGAFETVGLTCMACNRFAARDGTLGSKVDVPRDGFEAVTASALQAWAKGIAPRVERGELFLQFAIGTRDGQRPCSQALWDLFAKHDLVDPEQPKKTLTCYGEGEADDPSRCDYARDGWVSYAGEMHHYGLLIKSYAPSVAWHLDRLTRAYRARSKP